MGAYEFRMPEFEVDLQINPRTLNAKSRGNFISAVLTLPPQLDAIDVSDEPLTLYPGEISSQNCRRSHNKITCKFDRRQLIAALPDDTEAIEIEVVGQFTNGSYFYGTDTLRIIHR